MSSFALLLLDFSLAVTAVSVVSYVHWSGLVALAVVTVDVSDVAVCIRGYVADSLVNLVKTSVSESVDV